MASDNDMRPHTNPDPITTYDVYKRPATEAARQRVKRPNEAAQPPERQSL